MSVGISWANKMEKAQCDISVGFPNSSHIYYISTVLLLLQIYLYHKMHIVIEKNQLANKHM